MAGMILTTLLLLAAERSPIDQAGQVAVSFWSQFPGVKCTERVVQTKLRANGDVATSRKSEFDYVAFLKSQAGTLSIEESRIARSAAKPDEQHELLLTSGFPSFMLMFHPDFRDRFEFQTPASATPGGVIPVAFKSRPDAHSMSALKLRDRTYPILWTGVAWIDAKTGAISKIEAEMGTSMEEFGLSGLRAEVEYEPVMLSAASIWLPRRATVSLRTPRQQWRNVHEYTDYRLFSVTTSSQPANPK